MTDIRPHRRKANHHHDLAPALAYLRDSFIAMHGEEAWHLDNIVPTIRRIVIPSAEHATIAIAARPVGGTAHDAVMTLYGWWPLGLQIGHEEKRIGEMFDRDAPALPDMRLLQ